MNTKNEILESPEDVDAQEKIIAPEIEVEIVDDSEEAKAADVETQKQEKERESRSQRLKRQRDMARKQAIEASQNEARLRAELDELKKSQHSNLKVGYEAAAKNLDEAITLAESNFAKAFDSGDRDEAAKAMRSMTELSARRQLLEVEKQRMPAEPQRTQPQRQPTPQLDALGEAWWEKNPWFNNTESPEDMKKTRIALAVEREVRSDGFRPDTQDYYDEIDARLAEHSPAPQRRAPVARGATTTKREVVKLTREQVQDAKSKGIPLEEYARYAKVGTNDLGYMPVFLGDKE